jgi:hypothetical protein
MVEILRLHGDVVEHQRALDKVVVADGGAELFQLERKIGVLHLSG